MFSENNNILLKKLLDKLKSYEDEIEQLKEDKKNLLFANEMWKDISNEFVNHKQ
jgi:cell shape-determining protein MreC